MKLNVMFTIAGVLFIILGLATLFNTEAMITSASSGPPPGSRELMSTRFTGVEMLGLGLIAWFVRNADASKARDGVTLGFTVYFALHALTSLYGQFTDTSTTLHWVGATVQGLLAIGFFMAGKASMSTSAS